MHFTLNTRIIVTSALKKGQNRFRAPEWRFNIKWLSDTELEYELPTGGKKTYKINEN